MSEGEVSDDLQDAIDLAEDAFDGGSMRIPDPEPQIDTEADFSTQFTKACRLLDSIEVLQEQGQFYTAVTELGFGAIERSTEAYVIWTGNDEISDFHTHDDPYNRAVEIGLYPRDFGDRLSHLYDDNRVESYYGGNRATDQQAEAMSELALEIHGHVLSQFRDPTVCQCIDDG